MPPIADLSHLSLAELVSLKGRCAVVTGGARGLGFAIGRRLVEAGASLLIGDLDLDGAEKAAQRIAAEFGGQCAACHLDVTDAASVAACAEVATARWGGIDVWVNNAGIYPNTPVLEMTPSEFERVVSVNLLGTFLGSQEAGKRMVAAGKGGVIINLSSTSGFRAYFPGLAHYVASKHAVVGLTKSLAIELGKSGIRVLAIAPTLIRTPDEALSEPQPPAMRRFLEELESREPLGRAGVPDDVARVALFCACGLSGLMTGSTLLVDAGEVAL